MKDHFGLRPIRYPDGSIVVKEIYYNKEKQICDIEEQISHKYNSNRAQMIEELEKLYPGSTLYEIYDDNIYDHDPENPKLHDWSF